MILHTKYLKIKVKNQLKFIKIYIKIKKQNSVFLNINIL